VLVGLDASYSDVEAERQFFTSPSLLSLLAAALAADCPERTQNSMCSRPLA